MIVDTRIIAIQRELSRRKHKLVFEVQEMKHFWSFLFDHMFVHS